MMKVIGIATKTVALIVEVNELVIFSFFKG
jgi:hypothetical protein